MASRKFSQCSFAFARHACLGFPTRIPYSKANNLATFRFSAQAFSTTTQHKIGLVFASNSGMAEEVASLIGDIIDVEPQDIEDVKEATDLAKYDALIVGTPTHNTLVDKYRSGTGWDDIIDDIAEVDFSGKKVAVFGLGDANGYSDGFCDALEEIHRTFQDSGASMVGYVSASELNFDHCDSKSNIDGKFVGLPLDHMNEEDLTENRLQEWIKQLQSEGMPV